MMWQSLFYLTQLRRIIGWLLLILTCQKFRRTKIAIGPPPHPPDPHRCSSRKGTSVPCSPVTSPSRSFEQINLTEMAGLLLSWISKSLHFAKNINLVAATVTIFRCFEHSIGHYIVSLQLKDGFFRNPRRWVSRACGAFLHKVCFGNEPPRVRFERGFLCFEQA